jgi:opacity protein-like surface antigen
MLLSKKMTAFAGAAMVAALCLSAGAQAQTQSPYLGAGAAIGDDDNGVKLWGGAGFNQNFGWEAQFTKIKQAKILGGFATGYLPFQNSLTGFGKLGINRLSVNGNHDTEVGFGLGVLWSFSPQVAARLEYEDTGFNNGDVITVGVQFKF